MELDARTQPDRSVLETEVCIVGAGPAGLTVAAEVARAGMTVLLVESGGWSNDSGIQLLNEATTSGDRYAGLRATRHRQIGGTANCWNTPVGTGTGAKYVPLDWFDLDSHGDRPGWPIRFADLVPYYHRAQRVCGLGPFRYEGIDWTDQAHLLATDDGELTTRVYQFGDGVWCRETLPQQLALDPGVTLCYHATVSRLTVAGSPGRVVELEGRTLAGGALRIRAHQTVLAAGAVENARLLLGVGHGDRSDWLGRAFMEHPRDQSAVLIPAPGWPARLSFFDPQPRDGVLIGGRLALGDAVVREEILPNASVTLLPRRQSRPGWRGRLDRWRGAPETLGYGWSRLDDLRSDSLQLVINVEQRPHRDNRITLGSVRDRLGNPRAHLHWVWTEEDQAGLDRVRRALQRTLETAGLGRVTIDWEARPDPNAHHHAGTTRMGACSSDGVVDPNGQVFGIDNLFVAGASVFPTAGFANPVLTIVALAIRLGEYLGGRRAIPPVSP